MTACRVRECGICRPFGMVEWGNGIGAGMRQLDDEGIGGMKRLDHPKATWTPFAWWRRGQG